MNNTFIDTARTGRNDFWLYVSGFVIVMVAAVVFSLPIVWVTDLKSQKPIVPAYQYMAVAILQFIGIMVGL